MRLAPDTGLVSTWVPVHWWLTLLTMGTTDTRVMASLHSLQLSSGDPCTHQVKLYLVTGVSASVHHSSTPGRVYHHPPSSFYFSKHCYAIHNVGRWSMVPSSDLELKYFTLICQHLRIKTFE